MFLESLANEAHARNLQGDSTRVAFDPLTTSYCFFERYIEVTEQESDSLWNETCASFTGSGDCVMDKDQFILLMQTFFGDKFF